MFRAPTVIISLAVSTMLAAGVAQAQAPAATPPASPPPAASSASATASQTVADVSKWTSKQWDAAKVKFAQEKDKWAGCEKQAKAQNLAGRKSWQFLYDCMTKS